MNPAACLVFNPLTLHYRSRFDPRRAAACIDLLAACGALGQGQLQSAPPADRAALLAFHTPDYVARVQALSRQIDPEPDERFGLTPPDTPPFFGMHEAAAHLVGATLHAAELVATGAFTHAFHPGGGLHHAAPGRASGFCIYNDLGVAIAHLRSRGLRVAYLDFDVHHGDGVQWAFYEDPDVLTFSIHQDPRTLFPGTGFPASCGAGAAWGTKLNLPLAPRSGDASWRRAVERILPRALAAFRPDIIVSQHGCDAHARDPLASLNLSSAPLRWAARLTHELAHAHCQGRWVATGGGGYATFDVPPRIWAQIWAEMAQVPLPERIPQAWRLQYGPLSADPLPETFADPPGRYGQEPAAVASENTRHLAEAEALFFQAPSALAKPSPPPASRRHHRPDGRPNP